MAANTTTVPCIPLFHIVSSNMLQLLGDRTILHCQYDFVAEKEDDAGLSMRLDTGNFQLRVPVLPPTFIHLDDSVTETPDFKFVAPMFALHCLLRHVVGISSTIVWVDPVSLQLVSVVCSTECSNDIDLRVDSSVLELPGMRNLLLDQLGEAHSILKSPQFFELATSCPDSSATPYDMEAALKRLKDAIHLVRNTLPMPLKSASKFPVDRSVSMTRSSKMEDGEVVVSLCNTSSAFPVAPLKTVTHLTRLEEQTLDECICSGHTGRALTFLTSLSEHVRHSSGMLKYLVNFAFRFVGKANVSLCMSIVEARIDKKYETIPSIVAALCMSPKSEELFVLSQKPCPVKKVRARECSTSRYGRSRTRFVVVPAPGHSLKMVFICMNERKSNSSIFSFAWDLNKYERLIMFLSLKQQLPVVCWDILDRCHDVAFSDPICLCIALCMVFYNLPCDVVTLPLVLMPETQQ